MLAFTKTRGNQVDLHELQRFLTKTHDIRAMIKSEDAYCITMLKNNLLKLSSKPIIQKLIQINCI